MVKYSEDLSKYNVLLRREFGIYNALKTSDINLIKLDPASIDQMLIFTEVGVTLKNWCQSLNLNLQRNYLKFLNMMMRILDEIRNFINLDLLMGILDQ